MARPRKGRNKYQERLRLKKLNKHLGRKQPRDNARQWKDDGFSYAEIARRLNAMGEQISESTVRRQLIPKKEWREKVYRPTSVPFTMHERVKGFVNALYSGDGHRTTAKVCQLIEKEFGLRVSKSVVSVWREEMGYRVMRARYGFSVRLINRGIRLAFAIEKLRLKEQFLMHVFSDEMMVQLDKNSKTIWVQTRAASVLSAPKLSQKILIWVAISWRGPSSMVILSGNTKVDSVVYQDILDQALVPFMRNTFGTDGIFVQDSAPCHVSKTTKRYLRNEEIKCEDWPSESPDANPIELIWAVMKQWLINEWKPTSLQHLIDGAKQWWKHHCTLELFRSVISGVPRALKRIVAADGGPVHN